MCYVLPVKIMTTELTTRWMSLLWKIQTQMYHTLSSYKSIHHHSCYTLGYMSLSRGMNSSKYLTEYRSPNSSRSEILCRPTIRQLISERYLHKPNKCPFASQLQTRASFFKTQSSRKNFQTYFSMTMYTFHRGLYMASFHKAPKRHTTFGSSHKGILQQYNVYE